MENEQAELMQTISEENIYLRLQNKYSYVFLLVLMIL